MENTIAPSVVENDSSAARTSLCLPWARFVSFGVSQIMPDTAENDNCKLMLAMANGFLSKMRSSANEMDVGGSLSRPRSGAIMPIEIMMHARRMLGVRPVTNA